MADIQLADGQSAAGRTSAGRAGDGPVPDDVICQIVAGELPAQIILRTPEVIGFLDHRPLFKGHVLVCPTRHVTELSELPSGLVEPLFSQVQRVAAALPSALGCQGTFVANNNLVSQSIPHLHVHVVPRSKGDGLRGFFWPRQKYADGEAADYAERIRRVLA